jgi:type III secretory pathway lipoprotein EscJ
MKTLFVAVVIFLSGCTGGLAVKMVELNSNEQLVLRRQNIGASINELNDTRVRYEGRIRGEEQGS